MMDLHALQPGYMLSEYRIESLLGEGGFGLTYLAFDTHLEKLVAIKEYMPSEYSLRQDGTSIVPKSSSNKDIYEWGLKAFVNEAKILAKFENPNIVKIYRFIETNGTAYIVMEHCEGGCLTDFLNKDKPMTEQQVQSFLLPIAKAMVDIHAHGVLHRDIKPENIMFRANNTPVLIDFGAAREALNVKSKHLTKIYTPGYAPLEQYSSDGEVGPWSDVYSLAAVAYICLTGKRPDDILNRVKNDPLQKLAQGSDDSDFLKSIDRSLAVLHQDRPQTMTEWLKLWHKDSVSSVESATTLQTDETLVSPDSIRSQERQISAQTEVSLRGNDSIVANTSEFSHIHQRNMDSDSHSGNSKKVFWIILPLLIIAGGFVLYKYIEFASVKQKSVMQSQFKDLLQSKSSKSSELNKDIQKNRVEQAQKLLRRHEFWNLKVNGIVGSQTLDAIKKFQADNQLEVTGLVDQKLLQQLQAIYQQNDEDAWKRATEKNSYEAYVDYQFNHRNGKYYSQATGKIDEIMSTPRTPSSQANETGAHETDSDDNSSQHSPAPTSDLVRKVQRELKRIKYNEMLVNGHQTPETTLAIKAYNAVKNQSTSGTPTTELLAQLEAENRWPGAIAGESYQDCTVCPKMIVIPGGDFSMGNPDAEDNERPVHDVSLNEFSMSETEVTFDQWDACYQSGGCSSQPDDNQWGRGDNPVINVNWHDAQQYIKWLQLKTGKNYRLPSESEWEFAARGGQSTEYPWGDEIGQNNLHCIDCNSAMEVTPSYTLPVKSFQPNGFGLYDMTGGVWEWVEDCWHSNYQGAPTDGSAWEDPNCTTYSLRSASAGNPAIEHRITHRGAADATRRANSVGFRVAMDM